MTPNHLRHRVPVRGAGRRLAMTAVLTAVFGALLAPPANAASCYGDYCSGKDPEATGCARDAYTVVHARIPGTYANVELRWSPSCKTNWARTTWHGSSSSYLRAVQCATGYTQAGAVGDSGTYVWTRQIYSPRYGVSARWTGAPGTTATSCS